MQFQFGRNAVLSFLLEFNQTYLLFLAHETCKLRMKEERLSFRNDQRDISLPHAFNKNFLDKDWLW